jgi:autotransporter-associated beta strand protein
MPNSVFPKLSPSNNTVNVISGTVPGAVYGGVNDNGNTDNNTVIVSGGRIGSSQASSGNVTGGWSFAGDTLSNTVTVSGGRVDGRVFGGWIQGGDLDSTAQGNQVVISGTANVRDNIYGVYANSANTIGGAGSDGNSVNINGGVLNGSIEIIAGGYVFSGDGATPTVAGNAVNLNGGSLNKKSINIYGGRAINTSDVTSNSIRVTGGDWTVNALYGGEFGGTGHGNVTVNEINITGGNVAATIYGGRSGGSGNVDSNIVNLVDGNIIGSVYGGWSQRGTATGNQVTIRAMTPGSTLDKVYGGYVNAGGGDAFSDNRLARYSGNTPINAVANFEFIDFNHTGNANIGALDTTATGCPACYGITLDLHSGDITFDGLISGTGEIYKTGMANSTLTLTRDGSAISNQVIIDIGHLQIGNGGTGGSFTASGGFDTNTNTSLIYNLSDTVLMSDTIIGQGSLVQRGSGTLTVGGDNHFTGGTTIENGTLVMTHAGALNYVNPALNGGISGTDAGVVNFIGANAKKFSLALPDGTPGGLSLSFRTDATAGTNNTVELRSPQNSATEVFLAGATGGSAFSVATGTAMHLYADNLAIAGNTPNDLDNDGTFNVHSEGNIAFNSGISGTGTLRIDANAPIGATYFSNGITTHTWAMGNVSVSGSAAKRALLYLDRTMGGRVELNTASFTTTGGGAADFSGAVVAGDGIITGSSSLSVSNGASLLAMSGAGTHGTLTLNSPNITLSNFALATLLNPSDTQTQAPLGTLDGAKSSNNSLLDMNSAAPVSISGNNAIYLSTDTGATFHQGDYLLALSNNGYSGIADRAALNNSFKIYLRGFELLPSDLTPRGDLSLSFGTDSAIDSSATALMDDGIWLTHGMNSLDMDWTGGSNAVPTTATWRSGNIELFNSLEAENGVHEHTFMPGDKVYVSGANTYNIDLARIASPNPADAHIVVSGLVIGQNASGATSADGQYTFSGAGGIATDSASRIGTTVQNPTGKLQKYGNSTLVFENTGGNMFTDGVDIYGGTVSINDGRQLDVGAGEAITFMDSATLELRGISTLEADNIVVGNGGVNPNAVATFRADGNFTLAGDVSGTGGIIKGSAGSLTLSGASTYQGDTVVEGGNLTVSGTLGAGGNYLGGITTAANTSMTFRQTANQTVSGNITGGGALIKEGTGTLTLSGSGNTYSGATELRGGTLAVSGLSRASSVLVMSGGTTFDNSSNTDTRYIKRLDVLAPANWNGDMNFSAGDQAMNFWIPTTMGNRQGQMLLMTGDADITGAKVNLGIAGNTSPLTLGDEVILIAANSVTGDAANRNAYGRGMYGVTLHYDFELETRPNEFIAKLMRIGVNEQAKAFPNGNLAGLALVNQSGDQIAGTGMAAATWAARQGLGVFGNIEGGWSRYETGSHFDLTSLSLLAGVSGGENVGPGFLTMSLFMEYGTGDYNTYNSFAASPSVRGNGDLWHLGGGMMGRLDFERRLKGLYIEGSVQAGQLHNDYLNSDIRDISGRRAGFDYSTGYYGMHAGLGRIWQLNETNSLDVYGKFFWMRQAGKSVILSTGETVEFDDADSRRLRVGARLNRRLNETTVLSGGLGAEREFDGKGFATTNGLALETPMLRGNTALAEINLAINPSKTKPLHIDLNVTGYSGRRDGATASAQFKWLF